MGGHGSAGATPDRQPLRQLQRSQGGERVESTRKLRRELGYHVAKLHGLQESVDLTLDDANTKALALQIREQAGKCLDLLDQYQSSVPGRMWFDAERKCRPLRDELRRTEMLFRSNSGEWDGRVLTVSSITRTGEWTCDDLAGPRADLDDPDAQLLVELTEPDVPSQLTSSLAHVEADYRQSLDALMALVDDLVESDEATETGPLQFTLPTYGDSAEQNMLVLVPRETGLVYEHEYGGSQRRRVEIEGFLVPAWADPDACAELDRLFVVDPGEDGGVRSEVLRTVGAAIRHVWYRGTGDRMAALEVDEERADELDEGWVPVLTPDGPAYLAWVKSD
jgi:hypothetical protein